ncbi:12839_t:CDS:2 [Gigaspora margarita]|uniref:12839_t:CDS:1 n=1 Tax=Gigaspora margarita TaxID=4874 RepID=A0ABN7UM29_GIGMA|nr:12839_t:CDS:2 [Gigaspora margarita]
MTEETWGKFFHYITDWIINFKLTPDSPINDKVSLNKHWYKWNMAVKETTNNFKATKLHQALKLSNQARKLISSLPFPKSTQTIIDKANAILQQIEQLTDYQISTIIQQDLWTQSYTTTHTTISELHKAIHKTRNLENNNEHRDQINYYINRRYQNFIDHTTTMIDSILKRHTDRVSFLNLILPDAVITEPTEIKEKIKEHFTLWTKPNSTNN